ncbi:porin family protein [Sulfurovum sp.]|uniref:porin family protein n=1 Tax=Sulfurovum sp. TaxID=1969726 RepID=UPI0025D97B2C|nr:porin family protein [Sulfurovum sp.]
MNTIKTSAVAVLLISTFAVAGGDIAPVEPEISTPVVMDTESGLAGFYVGLGYTYMKMDNAGAAGDVNGNGITLLGGYNFNKYLAVEGRYSMTLGDLSVDNGADAGDLSNIALYLKPQYTVDMFKLYGLLGYGQVTYDNGSTDYSENGFQYGAGMGIMATDNIDVYVDYTRLYDDDGFDGIPNNNITVDAVNVGVNYNF